MYLKLRVTVGITLVTPMNLVPAGEMIIIIVPSVVRAEMMASHPMVMTGEILPG